MLKEIVNQGNKCIVLNIFESGSQHVDTIHTQNVGAYGQPETLPSPPCVGREKEAGKLPEVLATDEALAYLLIFAIGISLYQYWRKSQHMRTTSPIAVGSGFYFGYCIMTIFTFRFFVEFLKKEQVNFEQGMLLDMGQLLSIPLVLVGLWCMIKK